MRLFMKFVRTATCIGALAMALVGCPSEPVKADFNGVGKIDFARIRGRKEIEVDINREGVSPLSIVYTSTGTYTALSTLRAVDANGDGNQDLVIQETTAIFVPSSRFGGASVKTEKVMYGNGDETFSKPVSYLKH